jgi:hypothetical protein
MTPLSIFKVLKKVMIKDATVKDIYFDIEATACEYAYQSLKDKHFLNGNKYNDTFMLIYKNVIKTLG